MDARDAVLGTYPSSSHLLVRVALGIVVVAHGGQKVLGWFRSIDRAICLALRGG